MGLSDSNKRKQKISEDPRNTKWAHDTSRPGFKMLLKMGWSPSHSATLTPDGPLQSKRLTSIPVAKEDTIGLGANKSGGPSASSIFSKFGSKGLAFVTASKDGSAEVLRDKHNLTEGNHFAGLLQKLNAANSSSSGSSNATPDPEAVSQPITNKPVIPTSRNASRAKFLKAKAQARSDPTDLAGILGFSPFPTPSPSTSAAPSPAPSTPLPEPAPVCTPTPTSQLQSDAEQPIKSSKKKKSKRKIEEISTADLPEAETATELSPEEAKAERKRAKKRRKQEQAAAASVMQEMQSTEAVSQQEEPTAIDVKEVEIKKESKEKRKERKRKRKEEKAQKSAIA